jgi:hypothetical protein
MGADPEDAQHRQTDTEGTVERAHGGGAAGPERSFHHATPGPSLPGLPDVGRDAVLPLLRAPALTEKNEITYNKEISHKQGT